MENLKLALKKILLACVVAGVSADTDYNEVKSSPLAVAYKANFYGAKFTTFYWIPHKAKFGIEHAKEAVR